MSGKRRIIQRSPGRIQPHSSGWARVPLSHFFSLKFWSIFLIFPQTLLTFFLILALRVGESPTWEGPGYATGDRAVPYGHISSIIRRSFLCDSQNHVRRLVWSRLGQISVNNNRNNQKINSVNHMEYAVYMSAKSLKSLCIQHAR